MFILTYDLKAVLESKWPAADNSSTLMWNRLRNVIIGVAQFRQGLKNKTRRSLSLSSETELDRVSRTSTESSNPEDLTLVRISNPAEFVPELIKLNDENYSGNILNYYSYLFLLIIKIFGFVLLNFWCIQYLSVRYYVYAELGGGFYLP